MSKGRAGRAIKQGRKLLDQTQLQCSMETGYTREAIGQQERGDYKVQPHMARYFIEQGNPWPGLEASNEYLGWGLKKLDGPAADLHRSAVKEKVVEEAQEMLSALAKMATYKRPSTLSSFEDDNITHGMDQSVDVVKAILTFIAVCCEDYNLSWNDIWEDHDLKLKSRGYVMS